MWQLVESYRYVGMFVLVFFFKQKTAYEMRISDWSSDVCSSDLKASFGLDQPLLDTALVPRGAMTTARRQGPLIIESYDTTIVVPPGASAQADAIGNIVIDINSESV